MSWAGRPPTTTPANAQAPAHNGIIPRRVAPSQAASRPVMRPVQTLQPVSRGLTPASAWLGPRPDPAFTPVLPDAVTVARDLNAYVDAPVQPSPEFLPDQGAPEPAPAPEAPTAPVPATDPMAPRADAPIFRLRPQAVTPTAQADQPAPQVYAEAPVPVAAQPGQQGSRYYSVHRETGHAPDRTPLPEAVFFDSVAMDLAAPPEPQMPQRDAQGRLRPPVRDEDPERP
jgi:hypothetical protein